MTHIRSRSSFLIAFLAAVAALTVLVAFAPQPAPAASKPCARQVIDDWYGDGRVDTIYPLHCYQDAIRALPVDVLDYSNAKDDILRALSFARKGKPDPGPSGGAQPSGNDPSDPGSGNAGTPNDPDDPSAAGDVDTSGPSSVPIPLLVLGGLALLLLAAGGAGYLSRRAQARREGGPPGAT